MAILDSLQSFSDLPIITYLLLLAKFSYNIQKMSKQCNKFTIAFRLLTQFLVETKAQSFLFKKMLKNKVLQNFLSKKQKITGRQVPCAFRSLASSSFKLRISFNKCNSIMVFTFHFIEIYQIIIYSRNARFARIPLVDLSQKTIK